MLIFCLFTICSLVYLVSSASHSAKRSTDPMADICLPLCEEETNMEMNCANIHGCYDVGQEDSDQFLDCMAPCWGLASDCYSLCTESVDDVIKQCLNICQSLEDRVCLNNCFEITFTQLKHDVLYPGNNSTTNNGSQSDPSTTQATQSDNQPQNDDDASAGYADAPTSQPGQTASLLLSRLGLTKTLRSDKSNSITVVHGDVMADDEPLATGAGLPVLTSNIATQSSETPNDKETGEKTKDEAGAEPVQPTKMDSDSLNRPPHSRWKFSKEELLSFIHSYGYLVSPYLRVNYSMNPNSSAISSKVVESSNDYQREPTDPTRSDKHLKDLSIPNMAPLGKVRHLENQGRIERLLQANRKFLQRDGVDMISLDKTLYNLMDILVGEPELIPVIG